MSIILILEAICISINNTTSSIIAIVLIFAFEAAFTWGWMATVWLYPAEILPLKIRARGAALATAADFLGNFLVVEITPPALQNIGWRTYVIFAVFNAVNAGVVWCFYPETAGGRLEDVDRLFIGGGGGGDVGNEGHESRAKAGPITKRLQWDVVRRSMEGSGGVVKKWRSRRGSDDTGVEAVLHHPAS